MKPIVTKKVFMFYIETSSQKVASVMLKYPEKEFSLSDLAKEAGVSKTHISKFLYEFASAGFIKIIKLSKIWRIKANQQNPEFIKSKIVYNLNFIYRIGLAEFLNEIFNNPKAIVLFGSFRKGDDISTSDIDIAIDITGNEELDQLISEIPDEMGYGVIRPKKLMEYEKSIKINRKIQLHLFNRKDVDLNVFNNIANGIVLSGFLEVKP